MNCPCGHPATHKFNDSEVCYECWWKNWWKDFDSKYLRDTASPSYRRGQKKFDRYMDARMKNLGYDKN